MSSPPAKTTSNVLTQVSFLLEKHKMQITHALPKHMTPERMIRVALTAISRTPLLQKCDAGTLCGAVVQASIMGLEPDSTLGECYIIPYWNPKVSRYEAQLQVGYRGHCKLARNSGEIAMIDAQPVHANDIFDFEKGANPTVKHKWPPTGDRGAIVGYWAGYRTRAGDFSFEYWPLADIMAHRDHYSKSAYVMDKGKRVMKNGKPVLQGAWADSPDWMCRKTVLIQALKLAPKSVNMAQALALDEHADMGVAQQFNPVIPLELSPTQGDVSGAPEEDAPPVGEAGGALGEEAKPPAAQTT